MSRSLQTGTAADLSNNSDLAVLGSGAKLLAQNITGFTSFGFGGGQKQDSFAAEEEAAADDDYDDESDEGYDNQFGEVLMPDEDEEQEGEEDDDGNFDEENLLSLTGATGAVLDKLGLRRKTFKCDIHHLRLTNLGRRRRDVQVIFSLGAVPGEGGAASLKDVLPSTSPAANAKPDSGAAEAAAEETTPAGAQDGGDPTAASDPADGKPRRRFRRGRSETSKPVVFKTDVAAKVERGRTAQLSRKFHGSWTGKYSDLGGRVLHMTLVEQTRFGNLVEIGTSEVKLLELASGSVQQEVTFLERDGRNTIDSYRLNFHIHFQEKFTFVMRLVDWSGSKLRATDETGASDPFIKFFIRGSRGKRYKSWYKRGGLIGRSTTTGVQYNTVNPEGLNAKRPLYYHGTRSDLENETLRIEVYDYDATSRNDLIGFAEVPLRGVLLSGRISTGLAMYMGSDLITAGSLTGALEMLAQPMHTQFGDVVKQLPNMTYLALHVQACVDLVGKRVDGMSDPYVTAVWASVSQQTRVIRSTCAPNYDEILYFPTNLVRMNAAELQAKGDIVIYVLHHDSTAPVDIGFCRIPLDRITNAPVKRIEDSGNNVKTRVYEGRQLLQQPGVTRRDAHAGEIKLRLYFTPDLPNDVVLQESRHAAHELPEAYQQREIDWRSGIPYRFLANGRFLCSTLDETNTRRFLPTYLSKCAPPRDMNDPKQIARMVHCITFQMDAHLQRKRSTNNNSQHFGGEELWSSPNYFLDVKKGASEDHAVLQCSLFLGLGLDAYLAIGRLPGGVQQHVWVMTREPNGDVLFWETTKGDYYTLPSRWSGLYLEGVAATAPSSANEGGRTVPKISRSQTRAKTVKVEGVEVDDKRKLRAVAALARDKAEREAEKKAQALAKQQAREEAILYLAQEEQWTTPSTANPFETPRDFDGKEIAANGGMEEDVEMKMMMEQLDHPDLLNGPKSNMRESLQASINKTQMLASTTSKLQGRGDLEVSVSEAKSRKRLDSVSSVAPRQDLVPMREQLPYETLEVLVNHENVWANTQGHNIPALTFNVEEEDKWHPFVEGGVFEPSPPPRPFYSVARIGPQLPPQRLSALRSQFMRSIKVAYTDWRTTRALRTRWATTLESTLEQGLQVLETTACSSNETDARAVDKWRGVLLQSLPPDFKFVGRAFSFSISTPELMVNHLMENYDYHTIGHKDAIFALAVKCFPHYAAVSSTWIYIGVLTPHSKRKGKNKGELVEAS